MPKFVALVLIVASVLVINGCAYLNGVDLVANGSTQVRISASDQATVVAPRVQQYGDQIYVEGKVLNTGPKRIVQGFVQVDVIDAKGARVDTAKSRYSFRHFGSTKSKVAGFSTELSITPPAGSTVIIQHYDDREQYDDDTGTGSLEIM